MQRSYYMRDKMHEPIMRINFIFKVVSEVMLLLSWKEFFKVWENHLVALEMEGHLRRWLCGRWLMAHSSGLQKCKTNHTLHSCAYREPENFPHTYPFINDSNHKILILLRLFFRVSHIHHRDPCILVEWMPFWKEWFQKNVNKGKQKVFVLWLSMLNIKKEVRGY